MRELRRWVKLVGPWLLLLILMAIALYWISLTPFALFMSPVYWLSFAGWALAARFFIPMRRTIRGVRRGRDPLIGPGIIAILLLAVGILGSLWKDVLLPVATSIAGFLLAGAVLLGYEFGLNSRLLACRSCGTYKYFLRHKGSWFCAVCGKRWKEGHDTPNRAG
jgi:hypothetical protein